MKKGRENKLQHSDVPKHYKKAISPRRKRFGIEYHYTRMEGWAAAGWYATEQKRDQAFEDMLRHKCHYLKGKWLLRKVDR